MNVTTEFKLDTRELIKLNPLSIESFSVEFNNKEKTISMFVNHRKVSMTFDTTIEKFNELLDQTNKIINLWKMQ
jgi:hypothetical protein